MFNALDWIGPVGQLPFLSPWFFVAGAALAAAPVIIHLLNRRRYQEVHWAAMDFLRQAVQQNRRLLELKDIILLLLRALAVVLLGTALAIPFVPGAAGVSWWAVILLGLGGMFLAILGAALWSESFWRWGLLAAGLLLLLGAVTLAAWQTQQPEAQAVAGGGSQPVHAIVLLDNSLSMAYESDAGDSLFAKAKARATEFIDQLPNGSEITVLPTCGTAEGRSFDPLRTPKDAVEAIERMSLVDRQASFMDALNLIREAQRRGQNLEARAVLISDHQQANYRDIEALLKEIEESELPPLQLVDVPLENPSNTAISEFRLQDGVADVGSEANLIVRVLHQGPARPDTRVSVAITERQPDGLLRESELGSQLVNLEASEDGAETEVVFRHRFQGVDPEPGRPVFVALRASVGPDRLPLDDERTLVAPIVAALPVLFIDQYSDEEEARDENLHGETYTVRRLLAPLAGDEAAAQQPIDIRHVTLSELTEEELRPARLVVVAGIADPSSQVELLREYVEQGGQLVIAAGGEFDPAAWQQAAWLDGDGILPAPLESETYGELPGARGETTPFSLSFESMKDNQEFRLVGASEEDLEDLYSAPYFFKTTVVDDSESARKEFIDSEVKRLETHWKLAGEIREERDKLLARGDRSPAEDARLLELQAELEELEPAWLLWKSTLDPFGLSGVSDDPEERERQLRELAATSAPMVLARYRDPDHPFMVKRRIGAGAVVYFSSGLYREWNTWALTDAVLILDRSLRGMIQSTLPKRNWEDADQLAVATPIPGPGTVFAAFRPLPPGVRQPLTVVGGVEPDLSQLSRETQAALTPELLEVGFIGPETRGVTLRNTLDRGVYTVFSQPRDMSAEPDPNRSGLEFRAPLAVNGAAAESRLIPLDSEQIAMFEAFDDERVRWVASGDAITTEGGRRGSQYLWWFVALGLLGALIVEMLMLGWPSNPTAAGSAAPGNVAHGPTPIGR